MSGVKAQAGQNAGELSCCGKPMKRIEPFIYECRNGCDCNVIVGDGLTVRAGVIDTVHRCSRH